jgi:hypothetical protein
MEDPLKQHSKVKLRIRFTHFLILPSGQILFGVSPFPTTFYLAIASTETRHLHGYHAVTYRVPKQSHPPDSA